MLQGNRPAEAPQWGLGDGGHPGVRGEAVRPARYQPEARAALRLRQQRLDRVQAAGRQPERRARGDRRIQVRRGVEGPEVNRAARPDPPGRIRRLQRAPDVVDLLRIDGDRTILGRVPVAGAPTDPPLPPDPRR
jgi:hypothetical protein